MQQQDFNLTHPVSHSRDPETSKASEAKVTNSGARMSNNRWVAWMVARWPGLTASELAAKTTTLHFAPIPELHGVALLFEIRRRLSDMNGIHVRRGTKDEARMGLLKNKESIWWPK